MVIKSIAEGKGLVSVTVRGGGDEMEVIFTVTPGRLAKLSAPLVEGMELDEALYTELEHASEVTSAVRQAAALLAASDKSKKQLHRRLTEKGVAPEVAEEAVEFMVRKGYLNESRQAEAYAAAALRSKYHGKRRIERELYARGYDAGVIRETVDSISEEDYAAALGKYLAKTLRKGYNGEKDETRKIVAAAERLGHSPGEVLRYLRTWGK